MKNVMGIIYTNKDDLSLRELTSQRSVAALHDARPTVTSVIKAGDRTEDIKRKAYTFELEQIQSAYEDDRLSRAHAQRMRESVQLMQMDLEDSV